MPRPDAQRPGRGAFRAVSYPAMLNIRWRNRIIYPLIRWRRLFSSRSPHRAGLCHVPPERPGKPPRPDLNCHPARRDRQREVRMSAGLPKSECRDARPRLSKQDRYAPDWPGQNGPCEVSVHQRRPRLTASRRRRGAAWPAGFGAGRRHTGRARASKSWRRRPMFLLAPPKPEPGADR